MGNVRMHDIRVIDDAVARSIGLRRRDGYQEALMLEVHPLA
jgi:hypothetical protein